VHKYGKKRFQIRPTCLPLSYNMFKTIKTHSKSFKKPVKLGGFFLNTLPHHLNYKCKNIDLNYYFFEKEKRDSRSSWPL